MIMKKLLTIVFASSAMLLSPWTSNLAFGDFAIEFTSSDGRGGGDFAESTIADFQAVDPNLDPAAEVILLAGNNGFANANGTEVSGLTITTASEAGLSAFSAGAVAWNDETPISDTYAFINGSVDAQVTLTIAGLGSVPVGSELVLSVWGIGDNLGQQSDFTVDYGTFSEMGQTLYNGNTPDAPVARDDSTGSVPFVTFTFMADGTDTLTLDIAVSTAEGASVTRTINGLSLSGVPVAPPLVGDFNGDGLVDCGDIDEYIGNLGSAATGALADLDLVADGTIDSADVAFFVENLVETTNGEVGTALGDLNCDGQVNVLGDAFVLVASLGNAVTSYSQGDINLDGQVTVLGDAFALVANLGFSNTP